MKDAKLLMAFKENNCRFKLDEKCGKYFASFNVVNSTQIYTKTVFFRYLPGHGTTFESGGLCRRNCEDMIRADMASAAILLGVFDAVAGMRLPINLRGK